MSPQSSVISVVNGGRQPDPIAFKPVDWHVLEPSHTDVTGPKATNKFWTNWLVDNRTIAKGTGAEFPISPMPYVIKWGKVSTTVGKYLPPALEISRSDPEFGYMAWGSRKEGVPSYAATFVGQFALSATEGAHGGGHNIIQESLFGVHVQVRGPPDTDRHITFPIYSGNAYVSGRYSGFTPKIASTADRHVEKVTKISDGIFEAVNDAGTKFRVYVLDADCEFHSSFSFDSHGVGTSKLDGWVRMAELRTAADASILDAHARAVVVGMELDVLAAGRVTYSFKTARGLSSPPEE